MPRLDPRLQVYAHEMRGKPTPFEAILWRSLSNSKLGGYKFRRQTLIGGHICDFSCSLVALTVEVDGGTHEFKHDRARDAVLAHHGYKTLHFTNEEVRNNLDGVLTKILVECQERELRYPRSAVRPAPPHPNPSPEGEGLEK